MPEQIQSTIRCSNCGQPFIVTLHALVDPVQDPQSKILLMTNCLNNASCPNCGTVNVVSAPLLYHDSSKELLVAYVPMELNLTKDQQERIIGDLLKNLPKENFKGYMFSPKRTLTMQGLIDMIYEADGVTPEMLEKQKQRVRLAQRMAEAASEAELTQLVNEHDADIDEQFFQTLTMIAQRMIESGRPDMAQDIILRQSHIAELSTYGKQLIAQQEAQEQMLAEVAQEIEAIGDTPQRSDFFELAKEYLADDMKLQALVGLARPAFDYGFFQDMTVAIGQAPTSEREELEALRDRLLQLTEAVDKQARAAVQNATGFLQSLLGTPDPDALIRANAHVIDDTFMAVLAANIQEAERLKNGEAASRLKNIYGKVVAMLQETMQPELLFVNQLLSVDSEDDARAMIAERAREFGEPLLEVIDAVGEVLAGQGNQTLQSRLELLRKDVVAALA